jgi:hypothetical protein
MIGSKGGCLNHDEGDHSEETFAFEGGDLDRDYHDFGIDCVGHWFVYVLHEVAEIDLAMGTKAHVAQKTVFSSEFDHLVFSPEEVTGCGMSHVETDSLCEEDSSSLHLQTPSSFEEKAFLI